MVPYVLVTHGLATSFKPFSTARFPLWLVRFSSGTLGNHCWETVICKWHTAYRKHIIQKNA